MNPEEPSYLFWHRSAVTSLWILHVQFIQHAVKQSRKKQFLTQMANLATMKANSYGVSLMPIVLLSRKLVLPGTDVSHYHEKL